MRWSSRVVAGVVAAVVVGSPVVQDPTDDSYPLSTYPMFATDRGAVHDIPTAVEIDGTGGVRRLSPELIAGGDEPVSAAVAVADAVGRGEADALCAEILARLGPGHTVEIRTERVDVVAYVADGVEGEVVSVEARCDR